MLVLLLALLPLAGLYALKMLPSLFWILVPLTFLLVSLGWSHEWLLDRTGIRRWVKLAFLIVGWFGALFAAYITTRVQGVPTLDPALEAHIFPFTSPRIPAAENAAELYREAAKSLSPMPEGVFKRFTAWERPVAGDNEIWLLVNTRSLQLIRRAAMMPACQFTPLEQLTIFSPDYFPSSGPHGTLSLFLLLTRSVLDHEARGDLDSAWNDLLIMFRIARHWSGAAPIHHAFSGLYVERMALNQAMLWAADPKQTSERLRSARCLSQPAADARCRRGDPRRGPDHPEYGEAAPVGAEGKNLRSEGP